MIAGLVVFLLILGMFLQALTSSPRPDAEWQMDTEPEPESTPSPVEEESHAVTA
ncbi:MAG: hypothetical protein JSU00_15710 [Acidobacteria bacterium]|nr:hypothetical protein [Acidobacteriota bacterium]